jgi:hypothetical protein
MRPRFYVFAMRAHGSPVFYVLDRYRNHLKVAYWRPCPAWDAEQAEALAHLHCERLNRVVV